MNFTKGNFELQRLPWRMFKLNKLILLRGTLKKKGLSQALTVKGTGEIVLSPLKFLVTQLRPTGLTPEPAD